MVQFLGSRPPWLEPLLRGSVVYLGLFFLLRVILRRQSGSLSLTDLLLITLLADASQNAMADDYQSIPYGLLLAGVLIFWNFFIDWLGYHVPFFRRWIEAQPVVLIENGRRNEKGLRNENLTHEELDSQLRQQGVEKVENVKKAVMESSGQVSVIPKESHPRNSLSRQEKKLRRLLRESREQLIQMRALLDLWMRPPPNPPPPRASRPRGKRGPEGPKKGRPSDPNGKRH